ncbi:MAG: sugar ABC transporter substrate-binding protein [Christensenellales bacterium]
MKKSLRICSLVLVILMMLAVLVGCQDAAKPAESKKPDVATAAPTEGAKPTEGGKKKVLGFLPSAMTSIFFQHAADAAEVIAQSNGYEVQIQAPPSEADYAGAVAIMDDMVANGVAGIMLCTNSQESLAPAIDRAYDAGVPVVFFVTTTVNTDCKAYAYVGYDQIAGAASIADWVNTKMNGTANVAIIQGLPSYYTTERQGGFEDNAKKNYPGLKTVAVASGEWETDKANKATMDILQAHPEVNVIYSLSDPMAQGVWSACNQLGRNDIVIIGYDGTPDVLQSIKEGKISATLYTGPSEMGALACEMVLKAINGEKLADKIVKSPTIVVDATTVAKYIKP